MRREAPNALGYYGNLLPGPIDRGNVFIGIYFGLYMKRGYVVSVLITIVFVVIGAFAGAQYTHCKTFDKGTWCMPAMLLNFVLGLPGFIIFHLMDSDGVFAYLIGLILDIVWAYFLASLILKLVFKLSGKSTKLPSDSV